MKAANEEFEHSPENYAELMRDHNEAVRQRQNNNMIFQLSMYVVFMAIGFMGAMFAGAFNG